MVRTRSRAAQPKSEPVAAPTKAKRSTKTKPKSKTPDIESVTTLIDSLPDKTDESDEQEVLQLSVRPSSAIVNELEPISFEGEDELDPDVLNQFRKSTVIIRQQLRNQLIGVVIIGRELIKLKEASPPKSFERWFDSLFGQDFSLATADHYMNAARLARKYTIEQLQALPLNALYRVATHMVPPEVQEQVITVIAPEAQASGNPLSSKDVRKIVNAYRKLQLESVERLAPEVRPLLLTSSISEDKEELERLARLSARKQKEVVQVLKDNKISDVRQALTILRQANEEPEEDLIEAEVISTHNKLITKQGFWLDMLEEMESESVDLIFAEMPLAKSALDDYRPLAEQASRILKPSGLLLSVVSQQNIQFVGPQLDPLQIAWTFMLMRRPGHSPRIVGRITFASSYIPLSLAYKSPLKSIPGLVDDVRTGIPSSIMDFHYDKVGDDDPFKESTSSLTSLETSIEYYLKILLQSTDTFLHLVHSKDQSFGINDHLYKVAFEAQASEVFSLIGR